MAAKRNQSEETSPDLLPAKAFSVLKAQLSKLEGLRGRNYQEADAAEDEWYNLTAKLVLRSFGSGSPNYDTFRRARGAGDHFISAGYGYTGVPHAQNQRNFEARQQAYGAVLRSCVAELELDLPESGIKGVYESGEQWEFYRDVAACLTLAKNEIFIIDAYLSAEIFDVYAKAIPRTVQFRLLSSNIPGDVKALAQKYAAGGNLALRSSISVHDRVLFADSRVWVSGQSLKDAAKVKPTYIVEHDEPLMRAVYEGLWRAATVVI